MTSVNNELKKIIEEYFNDELPIGPWLYEKFTSDSDFHESLMVMEEIYPFIVGAELGYEVWRGE